MHRDKTTGLALAILLIGFVSSLCFPRQSDEPEEEETPLKHEAIIQKRIDEGINRPYSPPGVDLKGVETATEETVVDDPDRSAPAPGGWEFPERESTTARNDRPSRALTQKSIEEELNPNNLVPIPVPAHNEDWEAEKTTANDFQGDSTEVTNDENDVQDFVVHKVERGDTLSSLGARYLGNSARFMEIFEANRDSLKSPSAIYIGMKLRIPNKNGSTNSTAKSPRSKQKSDAANKEDSKRTAKGRFIPARRNPFRAGQAIPRESASLQGKQIPIKKLSQVPPEDLNAN